MTLACFSTKCMFLRSHAALNSLLLWGEELSSTQKLVDRDPQFRLGDIYYLHHLTFRFYWCLLQHFAVRTRILGLLIIQSLAKHAIVIKKSRYVLFIMLYGHCYQYGWKWVARHFVIQKVLSVTFRRATHIFFRMWRYNDVMTVIFIIYIYLLYFFMLSKKDLQSFLLHDCLLKYIFKMLW